MFTRKLTAIVLSAALVAGQGAALRAGGVLETINITGSVPSPIPGQIIARVVGIKWDVRSIPVQYRINSTLDPVPNPLGAPLLTVPQAQTALQQSLNQWNDIATSFIDMKIVGTVPNAGLVGFDMVNELSFRTSAAFGAIASSPSTALIADTTLASGVDIDGDGDSDVSSAITVAGDVDADGDLEIPAGFYKAGTILDNDVQFNTKTTNGLRFTVGDAALDTNTRSVDFNTVATHEFGHSHGLSHSMENQKSETNGDGATMFPFIDTGDPASELQQRSLGSDDIAWSSFVYPEGTASSGPAAIKKGDIPFKWVYGVIEGNVHHGVLDQPIAGASAFAVSKFTGRVVSSGFSGTTQVSYNPATGGLGLISPAFNILDGKYRIPVPLGIYGVGIEPVDGQPVPAGSVSLTAQIGAIFGQQNFNEEFYNRNREEAVEVRPGESFPVTVLPGWTRNGIDLTTTRAFNINNFGTRDFVGFTGATPGQYYAVQVAASQIAAITPGELLAAHSVLFNTRVLDASTTPKFAEAMLTTGVVNADGTATIDLAHPLERDSTFVGQDDDFSPFFLKRPRLTGHRIRQGVDSGEIQNLFLVLRLPTTTPFPGVSALPPLIGLDGIPGGTNDVPILGRSFTSADGAVFTRDTRFNYMFSLVLSSLPE
jgi:hypothetical protein